MAYRCVTVEDIKPNEEIMQKIYEILHKEDGYFNTRFQAQFIGFYASVDTEFLLNGVRNKVPPNGYFITPYDGVKHMVINSLVFTDVSDDVIDFYIIY